MRGLGIMSRLPGIICLGATAFFSLWLWGDESGALRFLRDGNKQGWFLFLGLLSLLALAGLIWDWHKQSVEEALEVEANKPPWERRHPKNP
jgi:hypothetical protein